MQELILHSVVRYNLYDEIEDFSKYEDFIANMARYSENDTVYIYVNCMGGRTDIGSSIINAIKHSKAHTVCVVEEPSFSVAAIIALAGDDLVMAPATFLMFHNYSAESAGKGSEMTQYTNHINVHFNKILQMHCSPFLSKKEITKISHDGDIYIYADDISLPKRLARHFK